MTLMHNFRCQWIQNGSKNIKERLKRKDLVSQFSPPTGLSNSGSATHVLKKFSKA